LSFEEEGLDAGCAVGGSLVAEMRNLVSLETEVLDLDEEGPARD
jgi:hypothetical protein